MTARMRLCALLCAVSAMGYFPLVQWEAVSPTGTGGGLIGLPLFAVAQGFVLLGLLGFFPDIACSSYRPRAAECGLFFLLLVGGWILGVRFAHETRMAGMKSFTVRAEPLIEAVRQYERNHGAPPESLQSLVPTYLPEIPSTGMGAYPNYGYVTGAECRNRYRENPWALTVATPIALVNGDQMLYFPRQNYPEDGYGGSLERVREWAYVHE
jgi:hypothetical protein